MNRRLTEISDFLDASRAGVYAAIDGMGPERLEREPAGGGWTAAQTLQHLALAESKTSQYLAARLGKAIAAGLAHEQDESSVLAAAGGFAIPGRLTAPEVVTPAAGVAAGDAIAALRASHDEVRGLLRSADGWALADVQTRHALFGPMHMYQSLLFIGYHDRRHTPQIARAAAAR
ncbi:MAG: DinB family protein [Gemmatimonadales bacterium]